MEARNLRENKPDQTEPMSFLNCVDAMDTLRRQIDFVCNCVSVSPDEDGALADGAALYFTLESIREDFCKIEAGINAEHERQKVGPLRAPESLARNYAVVLDELRDAGLKIEALEVDTPEPVRCYVNDMRGRRGWYWLKEIPTNDSGTVILGSYGIWQGDTTSVHKIELPKSDYTSVHD